jgi:1,4-dihydroxy-2-naphthoate octaprenyltransferase
MNDVAGDLITVSRRDPQFQSYLLGTFSRTERALPVQSLNVNTDSEKVTFHIVATGKIHKPSVGIRWAQILKLHNLYLAALPIFAILLKDGASGTLIHRWTTLASVLACLLLMMAVNLRNDFIDYSSGLDRVHPHSGSRAIQKGWVTAAQVKRFSDALLILGILCGLPALGQNYRILYLIGALILLAAVGLASYRTGLKYRHWSELTAFLLLGPLLTEGIQMSATGGFDFQSLAIGVITGWYAVFYLHLKNFSQLMVNHQASFKNTMTWLGFEKGKNLLLIWWSLFLVLLISYHFYFSDRVWRSLMIAMSLVAFFLFLHRLRHLTSPVGSAMRFMVSTTRQLVFALLSLWLLGMLASLWMGR